MFKNSKYFHIFIVLPMVLGCAHSADGQGEKPPVKSSKEISQKAVDSSDGQLVAKKPLTEVEALVKKYKTDTPVRVKIRKRVQSPYLAKEKVSSGELKLGKGIFRLDLDKPDDSTMVLDGKNIWLETRLDESMGGEVQVSKFAMNETRRANAVFAILFGDQSLSEGFRLVNTAGDSEDGKTWTYKPKKPAVDYKKISITVSKDKAKLVSFAYEDELENKVVYDFGQTQFKAKLKRWQLEYTPPKGVKPSEF